MASKTSGAITEVNLRAQGTALYRSTLLRGCGSGTSFIVKTSPRSPEWLHTSSVVAHGRRMGSLSCIDAR
jgi:hypothetical protein